MGIFYIMAYTVTSLPLRRGDQGPNHLSAKTMSNYSPDALYYAFGNIYNIPAILFLCGFYAGDNSFIVSTD